MSLFYFIRLIFKGVKYEFEAKVWQFNGPASWYFASLPNYISEEIRSNFKHEEEGWGRLKATVKIGQSEWKTAIWFDSKHNTYILPLKAAIRKQENIQVGNNLSVSVWV